MTQDVKKYSQEEAKRQAWRRGLLKWKCHKVQLEMYDIFYAAPQHSTLVWLLARQSGKSYLLAILALEHAIRGSNSIIKLVTDTKVHVRSIFENIFLELLADCPDDIRPAYNKNDYTYTFQNGSQIQLAGSDNKHYEKLRGQKSSLILVDEAGFCDNLEDAVKSVLLPTTTHTGGKIILASTPSENPDHDFYKFIEEAELNKTLVKKTIYDNPLLSQEVINRIIKEMGGIASPKFRREYLCEFIKDESTSVLPEFTDELQARIVKDWPVPPFFDCYESMDIGGRDLTCVLFGYYDFRAAKVIIQDELSLDFSLPDVNISKLVKDVQAKERALWENPLTSEVKKPYLRVSDVNYIVLEEISIKSNNELNFVVTRKDDKDAQINNLRELLAAEKIIIHPRCTTLIRHLRNVKWRNSNNKKVFARSADNGHYDMVDALIYLVRNMSFSRNPYPAHYGMNTKDLYVQNPHKFEDQAVQVFRKIFNVKKR